jgi:signal transduction histidine kinase
MPHMEVPLMDHGDSSSSAGSPPAQARLQPRIRRSLERACTEETLRQSEERLQESERRLAAELDVAQHLQRISTQLIQAEDTELLYELILDTAAAIMQSDFASIQEFHPERGAGGELRLLGHRGFSEEAFRFFQWVTLNSRSPCGEALRSRRRVIVPDVTACGFMGGSADQEMCLRMGMRAIQTTPLLSRSGALLGMISTHWREVHEPSPFELRSLDVLARQAADLIDRKLAEEALLEADRQKNRFLALLSHELRNPLAAIRGSLSLLERVPPDGEQARRAVAVIDRQTYQLTRLVDDMLDVTRITQNKVTLQRERIELNELLRGVLEDHQGLFEHNGLAFDIELEGSPIPMQADRARLSQVLANLLQNAAQFTPRGGRVRVSTALDTAGRQAVIRVTDTGIGIAPELIPQLFKPFSQLETGTGRRNGGLGLGLALVKGLVELHGGQVTASSRGPGLGAEFAVRIPWEAGETGLKPGGSLPALQARRILLIEDNPDLLDVLRELLELLGQEVAVAGSGAQGLAMACAAPPDVLLCDIGLPDMDGYAVARAFREDDRLRGVRLVALTGYAQPDDVERATAAGFDCHLAKPVELATLQQLLSVTGLPPD